jgi:hypothetical protein
MTIATDNVGIGTADDSNGDYVEGDDAEIAFRVTDTDGDEVDLSNAQEITWLYAESEYGDSSLAEKTQSGGGISVDDAGGDLSQQSRVVVSVAGSDTDGNGGDTYYHELEITDASGDKETAAKGEFVIQDSPNDP